MIAPPMMCGMAEGIAHPLGLAGAEILPCDGTVGNRPPPWRVKDRLHDARPDAVTGLGLGPEVPDRPNKPPPW